MSFYNYLENKVLDYVFGQTSFTPSGTLYLSLLTQQPSAESVTTSDFVSEDCEPLVGLYGYNRVELPNNKTTFSSASQTGAGGQSGYIVNTSGLTFGIATDTWGTISHFAIVDGPGTNANVYLVGELNRTKTITSGDIVSFPSGSFVIRLG